MKAKKPSVLCKIKVGKDWVFAPLAKKDGKPDYTRVIWKGQVIPVGGASYHLDFYEGSRRRRPCVGKDVSAVKRALATQLYVLECRMRGVEAEDAPEIRRRTQEGKALGVVLEEYRVRKPAGLSASSFAKYCGILKDFVRWAAAANISHALMVDDKVIGSYVEHLRDKRGLEANTICDKVALVTSEMKRHGCSFSLRATDLPRVVHKEVEVYSLDTLRSLFAAAAPDEYELYQTFLLSGMREQEVAFLGVEDIQVRTSALRVSNKPELGFTPKTYYERTISVPRRLIDMLLARCQRKGITKGLVFGTSTLWAGVLRGKDGAKRDNNMLGKLKRLARRAGLNCGRCAGTYRGKSTTCAEAPICGKFGLHRFRHTYATNMLRDRMDIASLQRQLGHADLASTKRYLHALPLEELQAAVECSTLAGLGSPAVLSVPRAVQHAVPPAAPARIPLRRRRLAPRRLRSSAARARRF